MFQILSQKQQHDSIYTDLDKQYLLLLGWWISVYRPQESKITGESMFRKVFAHLVFIIVTLT